MCVTANLIRKQKEAAMINKCTNTSPATCDETHLVPEHWACPDCGQRHRDKLLCDEDGMCIACTACGTSYIVAPLD